MCLVVCFMLLLVVCCHLANKDIRYILDHNNCHSNVGEQAASQHAVPRITHKVHCIDRWARTSMSPQKCPFMWGILVPI